MTGHIYIQPISSSIGREPDAWLLEKIAHRLAGIFNARVIIEKEPIPIPDTAYNPRRRQYSAELLVQSLEREKKSGKVLAVADFDLYAPSLNFVFGLAGLLTDIAVISIARLRQEFYQLPADPALLTTRAIKEAVHEVGHLYGLSHCPDTRCVMHFSNSLQDTDRKSEEPCAKCREMIKQTEKPK
ncbi:MAG: archaemetzincin family Zn-dependent metalloprotease [Thermodesulfobacteriota bacterium]|nr:archaemetzincin family Zn-dependent metalloprotease [Thermodesulfobacteriota bacterium]